MQKVSLQVEPRTLIGRKVKQLRLKKMIPANIFGRNVESVAVTVLSDEFKKIFERVGETGLVEISLENKIRPVLIKNVQIHPLHGTFLHVNFYQVDLTKKVKANVPLKLIGEAPAVSNKLGVLLELSDEVEVEALPADLPEAIEVDVSGLIQVGDTVSVGQLKLPHGVTILSVGENEVVKIGDLISKDAEEQVKSEEAAAAAAAQSTESGVTPAPATSEQGADKSVATSKETKTS